MIVNSIQTFFKPSQAEQWASRGIDLISDFGPKVIAAIIIWFVGNWGIHKLLKALKFVMDAREYDISLKLFLYNLSNWALKILLILAILGTLGVETTSFAAVVAAGGLAIGLALQGTLSNFAGGVLLLLFKPFKVGDFIEAQGIMGTVKEIGIVNTKLNTPGNQVAIIPNGKLSNENIINYSAEELRKEILPAGVSYDSDLKKAKSILQQIIKDCEFIEAEPAPEVVVAQLADSAVNFSVRYWAKNDNFWKARFFVLEEMKSRFDAEGIEIPYPHQVSIHK